MWLFYSGFLSNMIRAFKTWLCSWQTGWMYTSYMSRVVYGFLTDKLRLLLLLFTFVLPIHHRLRPSLSFIAVYNFYWLASHCALIIDAVTTPYIAREIGSLNVLSTKYYYHLFCRCRRDYSNLGKSYTSILTHLYYTIL